MAVLPVIGVNNQNSQIWAVGLALLLGLFCRNTCFIVWKGRVQGHLGQYSLLVRLRAQSSISLISCKKLGSSYKRRGHGPYKAAITCGTNCKFRGFPKTTLKFDNLLAGFTDLTGNYCIHDYIYYSKKLKPKTRQRNRCAGPNKELQLFSPQGVNGQYYFFLILLPTNQRSSPKIWCLEFVLRFHYKGNIGSFPTWLIYFYPESQGRSFWCGPLHGVISQRKLLGVIKSPP